MIVLALAVSLAAGQAPKLASPGLLGLNLDEKSTTYYSEQFAQQLAVRGMQVISQREIATLLGIERQKQLLGCGDDSASCLAELGNALGADATISGSLGKFGTSYQLDLKILSSRDGTSWAVHSARVEGEVALLEELKRAARAISPKIYGKLGRTPPAEAAPEVVRSGPEPSSGGGGGLRWPTYALGGVGVAGLAVGTVFLIQAGDSSRRVREGVDVEGAPITFWTAQGVAQEGDSQQTVARIGLAAGGAALATAVVLGVLDLSRAPAVSAWVAPGAGGIAVAGSIP
jgi:hypothetical protein